MSCAGFPTIIIFRETCLMKEGSVQMRPIGFDHFIRPSSEGDSSSSKSCEWFSSVCVSVTVSFFLREMGVYLSSNPQFPHSVFLSGLLRHAKTDIGPILLAARLHRTSTVFSCVSQRTPVPPLSTETC